MRLQYHISSRLYFLEAMEFLIILSMFTWKKISSVPTMVKNNQHIICSNNGCEIKYLLSHACFSDNMQSAECATGTEVTIAGDVYSFGIVILEIILRRRPTDDMFKDGLNIVRFVEMNFPDRVLHVTP